MDNAETFRIKTMNIDLCFDKTIMEQQIIFQFMTHAYTGIENIESSRK